MTIEQVTDARNNWTGCTDTNIETVWQHCADCFWRDECADYSEWENLNEIVRRLELLRL